MTPSSTPAATPPVSPTGQAVVGQILTRIALTVFTIAGGIVAAQAAGIDLSFLPPVVPKVCALVAFVAAAAGLGGPGLRKVAPLVLLFVGVGLASCAHSDPLLVTRDTMVGTGQAFESTAKIMKQLDDAGQLTPAQKQSWTLFKMRFKTSYQAATTLYDDAVADGNSSLQQAASNIIENFGSQLATFETLTVQLLHPDAGTGA